MSDWILQRLGAAGHSVRTVHALQEVTLQLRDGDRLGLIGLNGAGKSTLLKVLADIYAPTHGRRKVEGRISSLFNVVLGFEPYATGYENIRCQGYLLGETRKSIDRKMESIGEFSELGESLEMPVRYYSAGMRMRLGFAIATAIEPDILLVDEVINAGDLAFREKAKSRMHNVITSASIVVTATHDLGFLRELCNRVLWMHEGRIRADGAPAEIIRAYVSYVYRDHPSNKPKTRQAA